MRGAPSLRLAPLAAAAVISASAVALTVIAGASAGKPADNSGCAQGWTPMVAGEGEANRPVPIYVDAAGNGDGIVCALPLGDGLYHDYPGRPDTVYRWHDNQPLDCGLTLNPVFCDED